MGVYLLSVGAAAAARAPPSDLYSRLAHLLLPVAAVFLLLLIPALVYGLLWLLKHPAPSRCL